MQGIRAKSIVGIGYWKIKNHWRPCLSIYHWGLRMTWRTVIRVWIWRDNGAMPRPNCCVRLPAIVSWFWQVAYPTAFIGEYALEWRGRRRKMVWIDGGSGLVLSITIMDVLERKCFDNEVSFLGWADNTSLWHVDALDWIWNSREFNYVYKVKVQIGREITSTTRRLHITDVEKEELKFLRNPFVWHNNNNK